MAATATDTKLTRAEDAYAHLASFQRGDTVEVTGKAWVLPVDGTATVTLTQQHDFSHILRSYLIVTDECGAGFRVTVSNLLSGRFTITLLGVAVVTADGMLVEYPVEG